MFYTTYSSNWVELSIHIRTNINRLADTLLQSDILNKDTGSYFTALQNNFCVQLSLTVQM